MNSMAYILLHSYAYNNLPVIKYFCTTTNTNMYVCEYSDLSKRAWIKTNYCFQELIFARKIVLFHSKYDYEIQKKGI